MHVCVCVCVSLLNCYGGDGDDAYDLVLFPPTSVPQPPSSPLSGAGGGGFGVDSRLCAFGRFLCIVAFVCVLWGSV